jgi:asparagine synthase (glutamine-hydrolysing)
LRDTGYFKPAAVGQLVTKMNNRAPIGETDEMALAGIISTQLLHHQFVASFKMPPPLSHNDSVKVYSL